MHLVGRRYSFEEYVIHKEQPDAIGSCKILSENTTSDHEEGIYISGTLTETQRMKGKAAREVARRAVKWANLIPTAHLNSET